MLTAFQGCVCEMDIPAESQAHSQLCSSGHGSSVGTQCVIELIEEVKGLLVGWHLHSLPPGHQGGGSRLSPVLLGPWRSLAPIASGNGLWLVGKGWRAEHTALGPPMDHICLILNLPLSPPPPTSSVSTFLCPGPQAEHTEMFPGFMSPSSLLRPGHQDSQAGQAGTRFLGHSLAE